MTQPADLTHSTERGLDGTQVRILNAAESCIRRFGVRKTSVGEVARVGKLSRGTIYRYYRDKDALVYGVFRRLQEDFCDRAEAALDEEPSLLDKLVQSVLWGRREIHRDLFRELSETDPDVVSTVLMDPVFFERSMGFWPAHLEQAAASGEIGDEVDVAMATDFVMRIVVSLTWFPTMQGDLTDEQPLRDYLARFVLSGLGRPRRP